MAIQDTPEFNIAWARIVARAAMDTAFRTRVLREPAAVFAEYGVTGDDAELRGYVNAQFQPSLDAVQLQYDQQQTADPLHSAQQFGPAYQQAYGAYATPPGSDAGRPIATMPCYCDFCGCMCNPTGSWMGGPATSGSGGGIQSTQLTNAGASGAATSGIELGRSFNCLGSFGTAACGGGCLGTVGTFGSAIMQGMGSAAGTAGTVASGPAPGGCGVSSTQLSGSTGGPATSGTAMGRSFNSWATFGCYCGSGSFGCGGGAQAPQMSGGAQAPQMSGGATDMGRLFNCLGSFGTGGTWGSCFAPLGPPSSTQLGGSTGGPATSGTAMGRSFNSWGTAATFGCYSGTVGTGGSFGCGGGALSTQLSGSVTEGATLGSFATYCGCVCGGGITPGATSRPPSIPCWGTGASGGLKARLSVALDT